MNTYLRKDERKFNFEKTIKVAAAVIQNENNEILCALRSPTMSLPNLWEFPGGKLEEGENAREALVREIEEELDCKIVASDVIADIHHEYEKVIVNLISIKAKIVSGKPVAKSMRNSDGCLYVS